MTPTTRLGRLADLAERGAGIVDPAHVERLLEGVDAQLVQAPAEASRSWASTQCR